MDLLEQTKELCRAYDIHPARSKGQNFLIKEEVYDKIIKTADLKKDDVVLEVGPGLGFLTAKLALRLRSGQAETGRVIAVELDDKLAEALKTGLVSQGIKNVEIINENILDFNPLNPPYQGDIFDRPLDKGGEGGYKIVANIPYNITSVFLRKFLSRENKPSSMTLMLQKEVAERICAKSGKMSVLAVSVQFYAKPEIIETVPANDFWPAPKVDSAIVKLILTPRPPLLIRRGELKGRGEKEFFRLVKIGFSARRKMLKNNLVNGFHISNEEAGKRLENAGFSQNLRAQELSVEDWERLLAQFQ